MWVWDGGPVEALSVNIFVENFKIRCCIAYGPQETAAVQVKENFWRYLHEDVFLADQENAGFILQMDGNLWAGKNILKNE